MGSCVSNPSTSQKPQRPLRDKHHPMQNIKANFSVDEINEQWAKKEKQTLKAKVSRLQNKPISFKRFQEIFPKLLHFSDKTQKRFFKLFAYEGGDEISIPEFLQTLTIIQKVTENNDLAPLIFFAYSHDRRQEIIKPQEFDLFLNENKGFLKVVSHTEIEELEEEINGAQFIAQVGSSQTIELEKTPQKGKGGIIENNSPISVSEMRPSSIIKKKVNCKASHFRKFFQAYNLSSYQFLFTWDLDEEERELIQQLSKEGIVRHKGDRVCLVEYQWFLTWYQYVERRFSVRIEIKDGGEEQNYKSTRRKSKEYRMSGESSKIERPGEIKNQILKTGKRDHQLQPNLVEQQTHISVRENLWNKLVGIYSGGPVIPRIYPNTYYNVVVKVFLSERGKFIPMSKRIKQSNDQATVGKLATNQQVNYHCYYKYPGKGGWKRLQNKQSSSHQIFNGPRTYITFVPKRIEEEFLYNYTIRLTSKKERFLKQRFAHYGNEVNISIEGVLTTAEVVEIKDEKNIIVEYQDDCGITQSLEVGYSEMFEKFNPAELGKQGQINQLAGLDNIGNTCYMNAVIQCLIRTPSFGNYLEQLQFRPGEELLIEEIAKISLSSKTQQHQSINTRPFKRIFEKHCPYFEGNTQHDAQEFLICLLQRLTEEIKHKRKQFGIKKEQGEPEKENTNKKVQKFFSGKTQAITRCKMCQNEGMITEPFFTYSLSLPLQPQVEFFYTFVPHYRSKKSVLTPIKYGITLPRRATVSDLLEAVKQKYNKYELMMYTIFNNEILNRLEWSSYQRELSYYLHFNAKLALFQAQDDLTPTFNDFQKKRFEGKSIKLELRQRIYSDKTKGYKSVYHPFILEVTQFTTWDDLLDLTKNILSRLGKQEENRNQSPNEKGLRASQIKVEVLKNSKASSYLEESGTKTSHQSQIISRGQRITVPQLSTLPEYRINIIKNDPNYENNCMLCKEELYVPKHSSNKACSGCKFAPNLPLFQQSEFRNFWDCILIVVDWLTSVPDFQQSKNDVSVEACMKKAEGRREILSSLLKANFDRSEQLQLRCERPNCGFELADRSEKIVIFPNILLLHLKRFTYEDNMLVKLNTAVEYPQQLRLSAEEDYELYGVVSHYGSGVGGHYVAFVRVAQRWYRCDDSRVSFATSQQFIDSNAYLLFYRKKGFQPSLITLSF